MYNDNIILLHRITSMYHVRLSAAYYLYTLYLVRGCVGILVVWGLRHRDPQTLHMVRGRHHYM